MGVTHTKEMVQGAMIAAIFGAMSLLNTYTGSMFDIFICYMMVIPITWYGYTYSLKSNMIVCIVAMFVVALLGIPFFVISSVSSCLAGLYIGECLKRRLTKGVILLGTFVVMLLNNIMIYEVFAGLLDMNLVSEMTELYYQMIDFHLPMMQTISLEVFLSFIPFILIIMSCMEMYVVVLFCQVALMRLKVEFPGSFHIATMHLSEKTGLIVFIVMFVSYVLKNYVGLDNVYFVYLYLLCMFIFALQGLSFISFYLMIKQRAKLMIFVFLLVILPLGRSLLIVLGILDIFSDLRRNLLYNRDNKG